MASITFSSVLTMVGRDAFIATYILTNKVRGTLYTGVTSDLPGRAWQHREGLVEGFTRRYAIKRLVWFELHDNMESAICGRSASNAGREPGNTTLSTRATRPGVTWRRTLGSIRCRQGEGGSRLKAGMTWRHHHRQLATRGNKRR